MRHKALKAVDVSRDRVTPPPACTGIFQLYEFARQGFDRHLSLSTQSTVCACDRVSASVMASKSYVLPASFQHTVSPFLDPQAWPLAHIVLYLFYLPSNMLGQNAYPASRQPESASEEESIENMQMSPTLIHYKIHIGTEDSRAKANREPAARLRSASLRPPNRGTSSAHDNICCVGGVTGKDLHLHFRR